MLAMLVPRKCVGSTWIGSRSKDHPSIHEYIMDWGDSQFFYTHDQPHFSYPRHQQPLSMSESLNGRMCLKTDLEESIRNSNSSNIIHRFIVLALTFSTRRLECLELRPDPKPQSNEVPPPNPTWCQYICKALPRVGHHAVVKNALNVFEICHVVRRKKKRDVVVEKNSR